MPDIALMKDKNHVRVLLKETRDNKHGDNSLEIGTEVVAVVEVAILIFPGHEATNLSNDSYCVVPTQFVRHFNRLDQRLDQAVVKDRVFLSSKDLNHQKVACCQNVVNHVPSAILHEQLQKKGVGSVNEQNKSFQRCPLCKSIVFCPICSKCPTCCHRDQCWGKASELLASLARVGFKSQSGFGVERRVQSPFQGEATSQPLSLDCEQICKSCQEQGPFRSFCLPHPKEGSGKSGCQVIPGLLQPSFSSSQAQQQMASHFGFKHSQSFPRDKSFQNGNSRDHTAVSTRGMGHLAGFQRRVFSHSHSSEIQ